MMPNLKMSEVLLHSLPLASSSLHLLFQGLQKYPLLIKHTPRRLHCTERKDTSFGLIFRLNSFSLKKTIFLSPTFHQYWPQTHICHLGIAEVSQIVCHLDTFPLSGRNSNLSWIIQMACG